MRLWVCLFLCSTAIQCLLTFVVAWGFPLLLCSWVCDVGLVSALKDASNVARHKLHVAVVHAVCSMNRPRPPAACCAVLEICLALQHSALLEAWCAGLQHDASHCSCCVCSRARTAHRASTANTEPPGLRAPQARTWLSLSGIGCNDGCKQHAR